MAGFFLHHRNGGKTRGRCKKHVAGSGGLENFLVKKIFPRNLGLAGKPLAEKPPTATRVVGGLARKEGEVAGLCFGQDSKNLFGRGVNGEIGETQSGAVGENIGQIEAPEITRGEFGKCCL